MTTNQTEALNYIDSRNANAVKLSGFTAFVCKQDIREQPELADRFVEAIKLYEFESRPIRVRK
jgi:hypothetical protein